MPFVQVYMLEGRTEAQKKAMYEKMTQVLVETLGVPQQNVRIWVHDMPKENWSIAGVSAKDLGR
ncbi:2-hydroxymuconate tautomerase [Castellaniella defragrans]|jgi:4-oxalocrotonate tautomerase|uniref:Tautomerase n=1 Tax=Castellaniella defragrans (strain DSM 12143 / CCUG 39792 / 65Phen) TaxID=1437824 RepID=W8WUV5_CASD6|nr:2-hydroxymuconate tautomerase [Castellaniella defragrans]CDM23334.1 4-oxalocrotonate tautomerase [Castellaniella defragrans 65Phen]